MVQPITAVYVREEEDYTVTVAGLGKEFSETAPGIIAARDCADQLIEKIAPRTGSDEDPTVVHLLNGSALEFTSMYMTARLSKTDVPQDTGETVDAEADDAEESGEAAEVEVAADESADGEAADEQADETEVAVADVADVAEDTEDSEGSDEAETSEDSETDVAEDEAEADVAEEVEAAEPSTVPGSAVPRKELAKSPAEAVKEAAAASESDESAGGGDTTGADKTYAAATGGHTAATG
ncbi:hypothetical protein BJF85_21605 [Saccharomonospora sp. CUA-673]|uniref:hypothetical protein n=1 Tax=Saccharomonospora sp. CUA-673 TaxID=1904969 RepID=UPI0009612CDD|nr:hypothetical protein [Saccharomonospora sp. CUA-673]OLT43669.1 hypothetical protein BJF85_21605 [Saccharomonospora sp. CUA-673]